MATTVDAEFPLTGQTPVDPPIPATLKLSWGTGALGVAILMNSIGGLILFYMVSVLKIDPALAGTLVFVSKLLGVVTDPVVGTWSDRLQTSGSRRRPFLLYGSLICAGAFALIFTTPMFDNEVFRAAYIFVALIIYTCGYALYNVPYMSMPSEMTDSYHERSSIHSVRMMFVAIAGFVAGSGTPLLLEGLGRTSWTAYAVVGGLGGAIIFIATVIAWAGTKNARYTQAQTVRPKILAEVGYVFRNRHFIRLLGVKAFQLIGVAATQAASMFFLLNVLQRNLTILSYAAIVATVIQLIAAPLFVRLSRRIGKSGTYIVASVFYVTACASWVVAGPDEPTWAYLVRMAMVAIGGCGNVIMAMSMLTDIINHDAQRSGIRREGVFTAFYSFTEKFTFAFGPLIVGIALKVAGFNEKLPPEALHSPQIRQALLLGVCYIPAGLGLFAILLLSGYKLKEKDVRL